MRLHICLFAVITAISVTWPYKGAQAQDEPLLNPKVIGVVGMAALCYWDCKDYDIPIPLYNSPDKDKVPATYLLYNDIENWPDFVEYEYEAAGALVYEQSGEDWYKIRRNEEFFWVNSENINNYLSYPEILHRRLTFLITKTDKPVIRDAPDYKLAGREISHRYMMPNYGEVPVEIVETKIENGAWWVKVKIQEISQCLSDQVDILYEGWIPAYNDENERNFWYYARGC